MRQKMTVDGLVDDVQATADKRSVEELVQLLRSDVAQVITFSNEEMEVRSAFCALKRHFHTRHKTGKAACCV